MSGLRKGVLEGRPLPAHAAVDRKVRHILKSNVSPSCKPLPAVALRLCAGLLLVQAAQALDPHKSLSQYSRTTWTQEHGLPQDAIRAITQTNDGYLWLGTDEGLARFDGYDFIVFDKDHSNLPANSIAALAAGADGSLWIGTTNGLTRYRDKKFYTFTTKDGLPDDSIADLTVDHTG